MRERLEINGIPPLLNSGRVDMINGVGNNYWITFAIIKSTVYCLRTERHFGCETGSLSIPVFLIHFTRGDEDEDN